MVSKKRVGGWLLVIIILLIIRTFFETYSTQTMDYFFAFKIALVIMIGLGVFAIIELILISKRAVPLIKAYFIFYIAFALFFMIALIAVANYFPNYSEVLEIQGSLFMTIVYNALFLWYFSKSKRVERTYGRKNLHIPKTGLMVITMCLFLLFVINILFVYQAYKTGVNYQSTDCAEGEILVAGECLAGCDQISCNTGFDYTKSYSSSCPPGQLMGQDNTCYYACDANAEYYCIDNENSCVDNECLACPHGTKAFENGYCYPVEDQSAFSLSITGNVIQQFERSNSVIGDKERKA